MADFALELSFDATSEATVREGWEALRWNGIPSQADNLRGMVNEPHLSLLVASDISADVRERACVAFARHIPCELAVRGVVILGEGTRVTLAYLVEPDAEIARIVGELRAATPALRHPVWTPHITLGRRIPREHLGTALAVLEESRPKTLTADRLRWWDPLAGTIETLTTGLLAETADLSA